MPYMSVKQVAKCEQVQCFKRTKEYLVISCQIILHLPKHKLIQVAPPTEKKKLNSDSRWRVLNSAMLCCLVSALASSSFTTQKSPISNRSFGRIHLQMISNETLWTVPSNVSHFAVWSDDSCLGPARTKYRLPLAWVVD